MKDKNTKKATVDALGRMIRQVDKGISGFWTDDYEGCGNPQIFPEFEDGLKRGRYVHKDHYLCPWNTAVLYGTNHGNINTGCYHSCSIGKARYLSPELAKNVLIRFRERLLDGAYDCPDALLPLLTPEEISHIEKEIQESKRLEEKKHREECKARTKKASALIQKHPDKKELFAAYYGQKIMVNTYDGMLDFNPQGYCDVVGAEKFTYDDYIDVQIRSFHKTRNWFATCYYNIPLGFKGRIEKKTKENVCFERIMVEGMYPDGLCFHGKEEHVWKNIAGFEEYQTGDCVSFHAEVYRYVKTSNGKQIDFSLRNPSGIKKIEAYEVPSDDDLLEQAVDEIICETCYLSEHCNGNICLLPKGVKKEQKKQMMAFAKNHNSMKRKEM